MNDPFSAPEHWPQDPYEPHEPPPRRLAFDLAFDISRGFDSGMAAIRAAPVAMWVGGVLMLIFDGNNYSGGGSDDSESLSLLFGAAQDSIAAVGSELAALREIAPSLAFVFIALAIGVGMLLGRAFFRPGFIRQMRTVHAYGENGYAELFSGADAMLSMLGAMLIRGFIIFVMLIPFGAGAGAAFYFLDDPVAAGAISGLLLLLTAVPFLYVYLGLMLADFRIAIDGDGAIESLRSAWYLADGNRWPLFKFGFVMTLVEMAATVVGFMMLCIGVFFTAPLGKALTGVAWTESYLLATGGDVD